MILVKKIMSDIYQLKRRKNLEDIIKVYEEAKQALIETESAYGVKSSYLEKDKIKQAEVVKQQSAKK